MAKSITQVAYELIKRLNQIGIRLNEKEAARLKDTGFVNINGFECTVPNRQGTHRFGVNVNKRWFDSNTTDASKPSINRKGKRIEIDINLFPMKNNILALHYLKLREYTLKLENEKDKWFNLSRWGMIVDDLNSEFQWVNNTIKFPLHQIRSTDDFRNIKENKTPVAEDINEPSEAERILIETYRILRDTKIARNIKELYDYKCQICGGSIEFSNGVKYAESHHVKPLGTPHNGPDTKENILCLCPNHHVLLDYGGMKLNRKIFKEPFKHTVSKEYFDYHNNNIFIQ